MNVAVAYKNMWFHLRTRLPGQVLSLVRAAAQFIVFSLAGLWRGAVTFWRWVTAAEYIPQIAQKPDLVERVRKRRRLAARWAIIPTTLTLTMMWALWWYAPVVIIGIVLLVSAWVEQYIRNAAIYAGRKSIGTHPGPKKVRRAFEHAKLGKIEDIRVVGPVAREKAAWVAVVELPPGVTATKARTKRPEIASAFGVDLAQVHLDSVPGHAGRVTVWTADADPFIADPPPTPLLDVASTSLWDPIPVGVDPRGRPVTVTLPERSVLIGGEPGSGKSVSASSVLLAAALDPHVQLRLADGKGGADLLELEDLAVRVSPGADPAGFLGLLEELHEEMADRYALLRKLRAKKLTRQIAEEHGVPLIVLHVDELQFYTTDPEWKNRIITSLRDLIARGRASGIIVSAATQRPSGDVVPTSLRDLLSIRWALRCTTPEASDSILGRGWASRGHSAGLIDAERRGVGLLYAVGTEPLLMRSHLIGDIEERHLIRRARDLREAAGTLPMTDARPGVRLLKAIVQAIGDRPRISTEELLEHLNKTDEFAEMDAERVAEMVRPYGVAPAQLWIDGSNKRGYEKAPIARVLDRL